MKIIDNLIPIYNNFHIKTILVMSLINSYKIRDLTSNSNLQSSKIKLDFIFFYKLLNIYQKDYLKLNKLYYSGKN